MWSVGSRRVSYIIPVMDFYGEITEPWLNKETAPDKVGYDEVELAAIFEALH